MTENSNTQRSYKVLLWVGLLSLLWWLMLPYQFHQLVVCVNGCSDSLLNEARHWEFFGGWRLIGQTFAPDQFGGLNANGYFTYFGVAVHFFAALASGAVSYLLLRHFVQKDSSSHV